MDYAFDFVSKQPLPTQEHRFFSMLSSRSFIDLDFIFNSTIHFEVWIEIFFLLACGYPVISSYMMKDYPFSIELRFVT